MGVLNVQCKKMNDHSYYYEHYKIPMYFTMSYKYTSRVPVFYYLSLSLSTRHLFKKRTKKECARFLKESESVFLCCSIAINLSLTKRRLLVVCALYFS